MKDVQVNEMFDERFYSMLEKAKGTIKTSGFQEVGKFIFNASDIPRYVEEMVGETNDTE